jgi:hypothetical protein
MSRELYFLVLFSILFYDPTIHPMLRSRWNALGFRPELLPTLLPQGLSEAVIYWVRIALRLLPHVPATHRLGHP